MAIAAKLAARTYDAAVRDRPEVGTLAAVVLVCGCYVGTTPVPETPDAAPQVVLAGQAVNITYVADPVIGRGEFQLDNHETVPLVVAVESAWLELGSEHRALAQVTVFDLAQGHMVDPRRFEVGAMTSMTFSLGFPFVAYEPGLRGSAAVGLRVTANGRVLTARSPLIFLRRFPRRP